jgi:diguanylate cyclase (GGDEF)-like protein/PAS domain S-box-containing protein
VNKIQSCNATFQQARIATETVLECMTDGFVAFDFKWRFTYINAHAAHLINVTPEAVLGKQYLDCFPETANTKFHLAYQKAMDERVPIHIEEHFEPWGRWFENHIYPTPDGIAIFFHEITQRHVAEEGLRKSQARLAEAQHLAELGSWEWDAETKQQICSEELCRMIGRKPVAHVGDFATFIRHVHPEDRTQVVDRRRQALQDKLPWEVDYRIIRKDGEIRYIHERGIVQLNPEGKTTRLFGYAQDITSLHQAQQALVESEAVFRSIFEQAAVGITLTQLDGKYFRANRKFASMLGYTPEELCAMDFSAVTHPDDLADDMEQVNRLLAGEIETYSLEKRYLHKNGHVIWSNLTVSLRRDEKGRPVHFIALMEDITQRKAAENELLHQKQLTESIIDSLPVNIYLKNNDGRYLLFNKEAARTAGVSKEEAIGKTDFDIFPEETAKIILQDDRQSLLEGSGAMREVPIVSQDGQRTMLSSKRIIDIGNGSPKLLGFSFDITERKRTEQRAHFLATHDPLTGLPNRNLLQDRLEHAIELAHRSRQMVAILFMDLDRFKLINDSLGHKAGDELLKIMAGRLRQAIREGDTVARLGGDEFVVLLEEVKSEDEVALVAEKILALLLEPVHLNNQEVAISTSIGISIYPRDHQAAETLLKDADIAMYHAKSDGGNHFRYFDSHMNALALQRLSTETRLRKALELEQVVLHYQPFVDLKTGNITGMEVLMRWNDPVKGLVGPDQFISIAEETGLIVSLGRKVLHEACRQHQEWQQKGFTGLLISVNLSAKQFGPFNLVKAVREVLAETGMSPSSLKLEITESELMQDVDRAKDTLCELSQMGVTLAIDDFGTGYSSLSYLKTLPINTLKVDRSFVHDVASDEDDAAIVSATISMAHHMGLEVIAEGVENSSQVDFLRQHECDRAQGYYFSRPLSSHEMEFLLQQRKPYSIGLAI